MVSKSCIGARIPLSLSMGELGGAVCGLLVAPLLVPEFFVLSLPMPGICEIKSPFGNFFIILPEVMRRPKPS